MGEIVDGVHQKYKNVSQHLVGGLHEDVIVDGDTSEPLGTEIMDDPTLVDAAEWDDSDGNITHDDGAGTITWNGAGEGSVLSTDSPFTVGKLYKITTVIDSITAGELQMTDGDGAFRGSNIARTIDGTWEQYLVCTHDDQLSIYGNATCDAVISNISAKEVTN